MADGEPGSGASEDLYEPWERVDALTAFTKLLYSHDSSTLATFLGWAKPISNAIGELGWTRTGDTGQVDWATVALPAQGAVVYDIWQPGDGLSFPIYLKVIYGRYTATDNPWFGFQFATGTDGAGNLTGSIGTYSPMYGNKVIGWYSGFFAGDSGRLHMLLWPDINIGSSGLAPCCMSLERSLDDGGDRTTDFWMLYTALGNSADKHGFETLANPATDYMPYAWVKPPLLGSGGNSTFVKGIARDAIAVSPLFPFLGMPLNPATGILAIDKDSCPGGNAAVPTLIYCSMYGVEHLYVISSYVNLRGAAANNPLSGDLSHAVRWD